MHLFVSVRGRKDALKHTQSVTNAPHQALQEGSRSVLLDPQALSYAQRFRTSGKVPCGRSLGPNSWERSSPRGLLVRLNAKFGAPYCRFEGADGWALSLWVVGDVGGLAMSVLGLHGHAWVRFGGGSFLVLTILELTAACRVQWRI